MSNSNDARLWAMGLHLSVFAGYAIPVLGWVAPIVIWQIKKTEIPEIDQHGRIVMNWMLSSLIYSVVCVLLSLLVIGVPLLFVLLALGIAFPVIGGIKAYEGTAWKYPLSIRFF